jgi:hypothetical protein
MISMITEKGPKKPIKVSLRLCKGINPATANQNRHVYRKKIRASLTRRVTRRGSTIVSKASPKTIMIRTNPMEKNNTFILSPLLLGK